MLRRTLALPAALLLLVLGSLLAPVTASADGGYMPSVPTSCQVGAPRVAVGENVRVRVRVSSTSSSPEVGSVRLSISTATASARGARAVAAGVVWSTTVRYEGSPVTVEGPRLPRGRYLVRMAFTPDGGELVGCRNSAAFAVGAAGEVGEVSEGGAGVLPDTGGPHLYLLVLGLGLVAGGAVAARRGRGTRHA